MDCYFLFTLCNSYTKKKTLMSTKDDVLVRSSKTNVTDYVICTVEPVDPTTKGILTKNVG